MTRSTFRGLCVCLSAVALASCQDYDGGFSESQIKEAAYAKKFVKAFGEVDPNQNWDLFGQMANGQNTRTRAASDITVTNLPAARYALITKEESEAYQKMLPESDARDRAYTLTNLGRVTQDFVTKAKTITLYPVQWATTGNDKIGVYYYTTSDDPEKTIVTDVDGNTKYIVKKDVYWNKSNVYALNVINAYCYTDQSKYFCGTWDYPTTMFDLLMEAYPTKYYLDGSDKKVKANDETIKSAESFYSDNATEWKEDLTNCGKGFITDGTANYKNAWNQTIPSGTFVFLYGQVQSTPEAYTNSPLSGAFTGDNPYNRLQSRPIEISIPASVDYVGFYIDNNGLVSYSESALNAKVDFSDKGQSNACFVATYVDENTQDENGDNVRYLCFEDWMSGATNFDLNDIVFRVYGMTEETIVDHENYTEEALLVCEDLGDFDFDFNDVVLKLKYTNKLEKTYHKTGDVVTSVETTEDKSVTVTAMAAGGANESVITLAGTGLTADETHIFGDGEIHELLNGSAPTIINADPTFGGEGKSVKINASKLATWNKTDYPTYLSQLFATGFVTITTEGGDVIKKYGGKEYSKGMQDTPTMLLLPMSFEWPTETTLICEAYPGFKNWVANSDATDWLIGKDNSKVTKR